MITIIGLFILHFVQLKKLQNKLDHQININNLKENNIIIKQPEPKIIIKENQPVIPEIDVVRQYDYRKFFDPLENPVKRLPRHLLPPDYFRNMIDLSTRGYPDNFTQCGILVNKNNDNKNPNNILRLFGRQEFPNSNRYEYYTMINSGLDQIKIPIHNRTKKELYDGDTIKIKELDSFYNVKLFKFDQPRYYPDIIF